VRLAKESSHKVVRVVLITSDHPVGPPQDVVMSSQKHISTCQGVMSPDDRNNTPPWLISFLEFLKEERERGKGAVFITTHGLYIGITRLQAIDNIDVHGDSIEQPFTTRFL